MKKIILTLFTIFPILILCQKKYYENSKKEILNEKDYKIKKKIFLENPRQMYGQDQTVDENLTFKSSSQDSIVYSYWFAGMPSKFKLEKEKLSKLKTKKISFENLEFLNSGDKIDSKKPTFVSFWFTNCPPCVEEIPAVNELKEKYDGKINFVAITYNTKEQVETFLKKHNYNYIHIINQRKFLDKIGIESYPKIFLLDKNQNVVETNERLEGKSNEKIYDILINKISTKLDNFL